MKKEEVSYLVKLKVADGLDYETALGEVLEHENVEKTIKRYKKSNDYLLKENEKLREKLEVEKMKVVSLKQKMKNQPSIKISNSKKKLGLDIFNKDITDKQISENKHYINRMMNYFSIGRDYCKSEIKRDCMLTEKMFVFCLTYFLNNNFVESFIDGGGRIKYRCVCKD